MAAKKRLDRRSFDRAILRSQMKKLRDYEHACFGSRRRFREREYLNAVYERYRRMKKARDVKVTLALVADLSGLGAKKGSHPVRHIIECSSREPERRIKSRWTNALRFAELKKIEPSDLLDFIDKNGGAAGCAEKFAEWRKRHRHDSDDDDDDRC